MALVGDKDLLLAQVILDLTFLPRQFGEGRAGLEGLVKAVKKRHAHKIGTGLQQGEKVFPGPAGQVGGEIMDKRPFEDRGSRVPKDPRKGLQDGQISGAFQVEHPSLEVGLVVVVKADVRQGLDHRLATVVHAVRLADEGNHHVAIGRFVEHNL